MVSALKLQLWYLPMMNGSNTMIKHSQEEDRYVVLGCVQGILYVVYTMRGEAARIISARMATSRERKIYYGE